MKMVEDMHGVRAVFKYGGDESGREIGGDILDVEFLSSDPFPKSGQSIGRLALTHMENPTALEVNDNGLVHMPFSDGKLVYADAVHSLKRGRSIVILKMMRVNLFDRVPRHAQKMGCVFEGASLSRGRPHTWQSDECSCDCPGQRISAPDNHSHNPHTCTCSGGLSSAESPFCHRSEG